MDYTKNFKTALKEIFLFSNGHSKTDKPKENVDIIMPPRDEVAPTAKYVPSQPRKNDYKKSEPSVISEDTAINGEVVSKGNLEIRGSIAGNVATNGDLVISGSVEGDISGENIDLKACRVMGDLAAAGIIKIGNGAEVTGSLTAREIFVDGKVTGNISASTDTYFKQGAFVVGNVATNMIAIEKGGVVCGEISIGNAALDGGTQNMPDGE